MQSKMKDPNKPSQREEDVITISNSSDEEPTIKPYYKEVDEDILFLRQQAIKSMSEAMDDQDHHLSPMNIQKCVTPSSHQEDNMALGTGDLSDDSQSGVQHVWTSVPKLPNEPKPEAEQMFESLQGTLNCQRNYLEEDQREQEDSFKPEEVVTRNEGLQVPSFISDRDKTAYNCDDIPMEVANNAEDQFFRDQMNPEKQKSSHFYWGMTSHPPSPGHPCDVLLSSTTEEKSEAMSSEIPPQKGTGHNKIGMLKRRSPDNSGEMVDTKVAKGTQSENVQYESFVSMQKSTITQTEATVIKNVSDSKSNKNGLITRQLTKKSHQVVVASSLQKIQSQPTTKNKLILPTAKSQKRPNSSTGNINKISLVTKPISNLQDEDTRKKHFPNLFTPTIISLSDSENEDLVGGENVCLKKHTLIDNDDFEANLDSFLKSMRAKEELKAIPPPKPVRKNPPAKISKPKTSILGNSNNSMDQGNSILLLMPPEKQEEYKRLKAIIEKKENAKKKRVPNKVVVPVGQARRLIPPEPSENETRKNNSENLQEHQEDEVEDENDLEAQLLREKLLLSMKKKKAGLGHGRPKQPQTSRSQKTRNVSLKINQEELKQSTDGILVKVLPEAESEGPTSQTTCQQEPKIQPMSDEPISQCAPHDPDGSLGMVDDFQVLKDSEKMLFLSRIAMIQRLTKLSEENFFYKEEAIRVLKIEKFAEDLRNQLSQVEEILANRNRRLDQLRTTMKGTYDGLMPLECRMAEAEKMCLSNGLIVHGSQYAVSKRGTEQIADLWSGIRHNVKTLKILQNVAKQSGQKVEEHEKPPSSFEKCSEPTTCDQVVVTIVTDLSPISPEPLQDACSTCDQTAVETVTDLPPLSTESLQETCSTHLENVVKQVELYKGTALEHLNAPNGIILNPYQNLCPFWLMGKCNDETCHFQHV